MERYAEPLLGITKEVLLDEIRGETVKAGRHRRVGGEEVPGPRGGQRDLEGLRGVLHETARAFQHGKGCMPVVQVTDFRLDAERDEEPPATNPEKQLLGEAQLWPTPVKLAGDPSAGRDVGRVVAVQQVELHATNLDLPGAQPDRVTWQSDLEPQPLAIRLA